MEFKDYLKILAVKDGSDLYLSTGSQPRAKFNGVMKLLEREPLPVGRVKEIAYSLMSTAQAKEFEERLEMNLAVSEPGVGRFRVNVFRQRNEIALVARNIKTDIPRFDDLALPPVLKDIILEKRGLVLFVGGTGSGKSTSLAALIDHRNSSAGGHIITIEDPIEFVHPHKLCIVNQREVGVDTLSYKDALKNTLRQAPDVILIGEIRDRETMEHALEFAETGHLAISTLHANSANQALDRIINFFPEERRPQLLLDLAMNFRAIVCQRLVRTVDGKRAAAVEVLRHNSTVEALIKRNEIAGLKEVMSKAGNQGMQTMDGALFELYNAGRISADEAVRNADSPNNLRLRINLKESGNKQDAGMSLTLEEIPEPPKEEADAKPVAAQMGGINFVSPPEPERPAEPPPRPVPAQRPSLALE